jgi:hypothetical protein
MPFEIFINGEYIGSVWVPQDCDPHDFILRDPHSPQFSLHPQDELVIKPDTTLEDF